MPSFRRPQPGSRGRAAVAIAAVAALCALAISRINSLSDYPADAGPAIRAAVSGDIAGFFDKQPLMGSFSLLLRLPFAFLAKLLDASELATYRLEAIPILIAAGVLALYVSKEMGARDQKPIAIAAVVGVIVVGPTTLEAFQAGHPEEVLGGTLCVAAVVAAIRGHSVYCAVLLGLALATKQWAVLAIGPVLVAAVGHRWRTLLIAGVIAFALTAPLMAANSESFQTNTTNAANTYGAAGSYSVWLAVATSYERKVDLGDRTPVVVEGRRLPAWTGKVSHPLIVLLAIPLTLAFWRRRTVLWREDALLLLSLLLLLRCVLDPVNNLYYIEPFVISITVWEALRLRGLPLIGLATSLVMWLIPHRGVELASLSPTLIYLGWTLPLVVWMTLRLCAPGALAHLQGKIGRPDLPSSPLSV